MAVISTDLTLIFTVVYLLDANKKTSIQVGRGRGAGGRGCWQQGGGEPQGRRRHQGAARGGGHAGALTHCSPVLPCPGCPLQYPEVKKALEIMEKAFT